MHPSGPLPSEIYWRRRALAIGVAVVVVAIVAAVIFALVGGSAGADTKAADQPAEAAAPAGQPVILPPNEIKKTDKPADAPVHDGPPIAKPELVPPVALNPGDDCPDATLAVKASSDKPSYLAGEQPKFTMVVTNIGLVQCKRDVGAAVLAASVFSVDNKRIWANLDCAPSQENSVRTFNPGEQVTTEVTWTGMGSAPNCPLPRPAIGPGTYSLVVQLGDLRSAPVPFIIGEKPADAPPPAGPPA
ncbi:hypothetical protein CCUG60885_00528 [Mycobacteroides salmoniphilum]|uniref:Uncharacterized protein n=2 Tax=Mycobacteroides salmoniphilum TaxID=404941 RepID=A0A4R8SLY9_9MYCO|nr:hypothetical protein CCUG60885_00528 [Mycobacteroides salmoniphilum]TEA03187.1 hypothetical protein CCUG60883_03812 [Mycobacteroides salmoniphilum]